MKKLYKHTELTENTVRSLRFCFCVCPCECSGSIDNAEHGSNYWFDQKSPQAVEQNIYA